MGLRVTEADSVEFKNTRVIDMFFYGGIRDHALRGDHCRLGMGSFTPRVRA